MKKNLAIVALVVIIVVLGIVLYKSKKPIQPSVPQQNPVSSLPVDQQTGLPMIEQSDSGKTLTLPQGKTFEISLPGLLQGDTWGNPEFDTSVLHLVDRSSYMNDSGDTKKETWRFTALKAGVTDIELANTPSPKDEFASVFYKVTVVIQ